MRHYIDRAVSARTDHRPDFQRMIADSAKGSFDVIVVWKLDRFARNCYDSAHYKAMLRKHNVKVLSATENISDGPEGIILESLLEGMAEYYSAELSENVLRGHTENALKCKFNGGTPTFGYIIDEDRHYQIDPSKAPARHKAEDDYLLTTKLICGTCRAMMVGECGTSGSNGRRYHYYRCVNSKKNKTCTAKRKSVRKVPIEDAVINAVMARVMNDSKKEEFLWETPQKFLFFW